MADKINRKIVKFFIRKRRAGDAARSGRPGKSRGRKALPWREAERIDKYDKEKGEFQKKETFLDKRRGRKKGKSMDNAYKKRKNEGYFAKKCQKQVDKLRHCDIIKPEIKNVLSISPDRNLLRGKKKIGRRGRKEKKAPELRGKKGEYLPKMCFFPLRGGQEGFLKRNKGQTVPFEKTFLQNRS